MRQRSYGEVALLRSDPVVRFNNLPRHTKNNHGPPSTHPPRVAGLTSVLDIFSGNVTKKPKPNPIPPPNPPEPIPPVDNLPTVHIIVCFNIFSGYLEIIMFCPIS